MQLLGMTIVLFAKNLSAAPQNKTIKYTFFGRLWRIYKFIRRAKKKKKLEELKKKNEHLYQKRKEKKFNRRKRRRKIKVVMRSLFSPRETNPKELQKRKAAKTYKLWKKRKRKRLAKAYLKGFFKTRKISPQKKAYLERIKKEHDFSRYKRNRIYRLVFRAYKRNIINFLKGKGLPKRKKKTDISVWKQMMHREYLIISTHSLLLFLMSYFFITFFSNLSMAITSLLFDYKTVVYYYKIEFLVDYDAWFADAIKTIFTAGPIVGLIIAILSLIIYSLVYLESGILKTLLLWAMFHGSNKLISGTLIGNLLGKGFGYVIMYLYYSDTGKLIMSLLMITISIVIGTVATKYWIMSANSYYNFSKPDKRKAFINSQVLVPFLLGTPLIWLINQPDVDRYDTLVNISLIFMILPPVLLNQFHQEFYFEEKKKNINWSYKIIIFAIVFIALYRILLDFGLRIG